MGRLSYQFCVDCACLAAHGMCAELRPGLPDLDSACGCSCAPHRPVAQRECTSAALVTPAWATDGIPPSATTPAHMYPSVRDVCEAGLEELAASTERFLDLALDYKLQAAEGNTGVIAQELCTHRRFETLACFNGSVGPLADMHGQACDVAVSIGRGHCIDNLMSSLDVAPLAFTFYQHSFEVVDHFVITLKQSYDALTIRSDMHMTLARQVSRPCLLPVSVAPSCAHFKTAAHVASRQVALGSTDAVDEQRLFQV